MDWDQADRLLQTKRKTLHQRCDTMRITWVFRSGVGKCGELRFDGGNKRRNPSSDFAKGSTWTKKKTSAYMHNQATFVISIKTFIVSRINAYEASIRNKRKEVNKPLFIVIIIK
ncbi:hypothetical protein L915_02092, partial [Phytophthora nicotianae]